MKKNKTIIYILSLCIAFYGLNYCTKISLSERHEVIPNYEWNYAFVPKLKFEILDTISKHKIFIIIKHLNDYDYQNLWLNIGIQAPSDSINFVRTNIILGDIENGWLGSGFSNLYERRFLWQSVKFKKPGYYTFYLNQIMRDNPLPYIVSAGIRIEK